jgi:cytoskeletal protein CcmA (bactofilin family)
MLNFNRRDAAPDPKDVGKGTLRPAIYEPPTTAGKGADARAAGGDTPAKPASALEAPMPVLTERAVAPATAAASKLFVGPGIKLEGVAVTNCELLVIEGHVEATVDSTAMEIAPPGTLSGIARIDVADIHGEFTGELTARTRLTIHGTGRVSGVVRYGSLIVAEGAVLAGDVQRLDVTSPNASHAPATAPATPRTTLGPSAERAAH